jgi:hypothetical protein
MSIFRYTRSIRRSRRSSTGVTARTQSSADTCCDRLTIMQPLVGFESAETIERGLQRFLIFPITHSRRLQVAMNLLITETALTPTIAVTDFWREAAAQCASTGDGRPAGQSSICDLKLGCRSSSSGDLLNTRSATISIYTSTAVVPGCCEMLWKVPKAPGAAHIGAVRCSDTK